MCQCASINTGVLKIYRTSKYISETENKGSFLISFICWVRIFIYFGSRFLGLNLLRLKTSDIFGVQTSSLGPGSGSAVKQWEWDLQWALALDPHPRWAPKAWGSAVSQASPQCHCRASPEELQQEGSSSGLCCPGACCPGLCMCSGPCPSGAFWQKVNPI